MPRTNTASREKYPCWPNQIKRKPAKVWNHPRKKAFHSHTALSRRSNSLHFFYDASNKPAIVEFNGTKYAYVHNLQGDIVAILDSTGTKVVEYKYDAWGRPISKTGSMANTLGTVQPFRYRGYVYDEETGLYYLRSRYLDASFCRFVNEDVLVGNNGLLSSNMYAYCTNRAIVFADRTGTMGTSANFAVCLHDSNSGGGGIEVEDNKYYEFVIIRATTCTLRDENDNGIGTVYANLQLLEKRSMMSFLFTMRKPSDISFQLRRLLMEKSIYTYKRMLLHLLQRSALQTI